MEMEKGVRIAEQVHRRPVLLVLLATAYDLCFTLQTDFTCKQCNVVE